MKYANLDYSPSLRLANIERPSGFDSFVGHVWYANNEILVVSEMDDGFELDGFAVMKRKYIKSIDLDFGRGEFCSKIMKNKIPKLLMNSCAHIASKDFPNCLGVFSAQGWLTMFYPERSNPELAWVGKVKKVNSKNVIIDALSSWAVWDGEQKILLSMITKVAVQTRYLRALKRIL